MNANAITLWEDPAPPSPGPVAPRQAAPPVRASTAEKASARGLVGILPAMALDVIDVCHFARTRGLNPLRFGWWRERLAAQVSDVAAGRAWDRWRADLVRFRVPHRFVGVDGDDVERGREVAVWIDVERAERRASKMLIAAAVLRALVYFPLARVAEQEEGEGVMFGGADPIEALASARKLRASACRAAARRAIREEGERRASVGGFQTWGVA